jgi:hypothetical protein
LAGSGILGGTSERMAVVEWQAGLLHRLIRCFFIKNGMWAKALSLDSIENFAFPIFLLAHIYKCQQIVTV